MKRFIRPRAVGAFIPVTAGPETPGNRNLRLRKFNVAVRGAAGKKRTSGNYNLIFASNKIDFDGVRAFSDATCGTLGLNVFRRHTMSSPTVAYSVSYANVGQRLDGPVAKVTRQ
jgi:hypothetical protein